MEKERLKREKKEKEKEEKQKIEMQQNQKEIEKHMEKIGEIEKQRVEK
jgi:hypothetical protein